MAKILKKYNWTAKVPSSRPKPSYPWDEWFDGRIWQLTHGADFLCHPMMMERIIRTRATNKNARVQVRHENLTGDPDNPFGGIVLQRTDINQPETSNGHKTDAAPVVKRGPGRPRKEVSATAPAPAAKAPARKTATTSTRTSKTSATKATPVRATKAAPAKAAASRKAVAVKKAPAKRGPRTVKVESAAAADT